VSIFACVDKIERVSFSPDGVYVFCAMFSRNAIQVFCVVDPEWHCRINEGVAGIVGAMWAPDSRGIVTESDFGIQLSVWSLIDGTSQILSSPKQSLNNATSTVATYSDCGRFLAVLHRIELQDYIGVYSTNPYAELSKFKCRSNDTASIHWTPYSTHIVAIDSPLSYKVNVYSPSGDVSLAGSSPSRFDQFGTV
jgi:hypothetical protein